MTFIIIADIIPAVTGGLFNFIQTFTTSAVLENRPASILADYIISASLSMTDPADKDDWPLYVSGIPDGNDVKTDAGATYDTTGIKQGRQMIGPVIEKYGVQLKIRSQSGNTGWAKIEEIVTTLDAVKDATITSGGEDYLIYNIIRTSPIIAMGREPGQSRRYLHAINFLLTMKKTS